MKDNKGKVITVTSRKGGVGKTTTLLNLAGSYSNLGKKTLILDLDLYTSSIAVSLKLDNSKTIQTVIDDIVHNCFKDYSNYVTSYNDFIDVLVSIKDPRVVSRIDLKYIEQIISIFRHYYDVVLIDTSHVLMDLNIVIYDNSDTILNIISNDPVDLVNTKTFVNIVRDVNFSDLRILLNESNSMEEKYFSLFDIRSFINNNIDYKLGREFFVKNLDKYVIDGKITTLSNVYKDNLYKTFSKIALDLLKER